MSALTYYPFDGSKPRSVYSSQPIPGAWLELVDWLSGDDEAEAGLYDLIEMFDAEANIIEVVLRDGEPIGVLDNEHIGKSDLDRFGNEDQIDYSEARDEAHRELMDEVAREMREARNV